MIDNLFHGHRRAERLRKEATATRTKAWTDFEAAVYPGKEATEQELTTP